MKNLKRIAASFFVLLSLSSAGALPVQAETYYGHSSYRKNHPVKSYFHRHQYQKNAAIGAGTGAAAGLLLGGKSGLVKGAVGGAAVGLGYRYLKNKNKI